ncbi:MAG TPA: ScyD/ScyE family protein [Pyrinomonadaceae bacterium]|nr:ScyD/ScyE family protein [Pyrinomonadaceae bacterium]
MKVNKVALYIAAAVACALTSVGTKAQSVSVFTGGLKGPSKVVITNKGNLLVTESGDGPNKGRLSVIDRQTRQRRTILDGLPAGPSPEGGISGPSGLAVHGRTVYVAIGAGDGVLAGPAPGSEKANPNPSSPLLSSLLAVRVPANVEEATDGFALTPADHAALKGGARLTLSNGAGDRLTVELVADFPDHTPNPRPDFADNVRASNPFGVAVNGNLVYVVDASQNLVRVVGAETGAYRTLTSFKPYQNPLPFGPPFIDAVPNSVRLFGDRLLVTTLTGFPFPAGVAQVLQVDTVGEEVSPLIDGLTAAIDVLPVRVPTAEQGPPLALKKGDAQGAPSVEQAHFFVLSVSDNLAQGAPGRLLFYDSAAAAPVTLAAPLVGPTCVARDPKSGDLFITSIFTGLVYRVSVAREFVRTHYKDFLRREPDQPGWDFWAGEIEKCGTDAACVDRKSVDVSRAFFYSAEFIGLHPELADQLRGTAAYNREFVRQSYYAYLRRTCDPEVCDPEGFDFWVSKLNARLPSTDADYNEMIRAFLVSTEYRARLGL